MARHRGWGKDKNRHRGPFRVHTRQGKLMSGKFEFFQGQGVVRGFYVVSGKNECLLKCQGKCQGILQLTISNLYQNIRNHKKGYNSFLNILGTN